MSSSGQKFVARNRAPRVQIEYDVELYGAEKKVQLPFVMGVMADLSGSPETALPPVADRKFLDIDVDNFDDRMGAIRPRAAFTVPNTLTGEGNLPVDLTFERMGDFSPAAVASKIEPLRKLLEARTQLAHLLTYMDGKAGAEDVIAQLIGDPEALRVLTGGAKTNETGAAPVLEALRASAPSTKTNHDVGTSALDDLKRAAFVEHPEDERPSTSAIDALRRSAADASPPEPTETTTTLRESELESDTPMSSVDQGKEDLAEDPFATLGELEDEEDDLLADLDLDDLDDDEELSADLKVPEDEEGEDVFAGLDLEEGEGDEEDPFGDLDLDDDDGDLLADLDLGDNEDDLADEEEDEDDIFSALDFEEDDDEEDIFAELDLDDEDEEASSAEAQSPFGSLSLERPAELNQPRKKFRIAILGDFTGRASRGALENGENIASRRPIRFDVDTIDDVIGRFATTLLLPIGKDGAGIEVPLKSLDDLHPDALYENVPLFEELSVLRQRLRRGDARAVAEMQAWAAAHDQPLPPHHLRSRGSTVPADRPRNTFRDLIGDTTSRTDATPVEDLLARIVGPHVHAATDPAAEAMIAVVDAALSDAMRSILHHPDFQAVEATWRSLEFLARRIETGPSMEIVLYDLAAEEWAADLAAQEDMAESGLFQLLAEAPRQDEAQGPISAIFGLYALEETPPHAELLARMARIASWMNASFMTSISSLFLETPKKDRHPLVAKSWDALRQMPEASHLGLACMRFLLRHPYGARTEPVDPFEFEEFSLRSGLKGMLWANPAILSATLMAATAARGGSKMKLGQIMSIGDIPVHVITDSHGDQVALPCTERLIDTRRMAEVVTRGFIPVLSIKGRDEIRQGSFQALGPGMLAGPWELAPGAGTASEEPGIAFGKKPDSKAASPAAPKGKDTETDAEDTSDDGDDDFDLSAFDDGDDDADLDDILAGFDDDASDEGDDDEIDPDLAALLEDL